MPKQTSIESAYKKPGDKHSGWGGCASFALFVVIALFLATLISSDPSTTKDGTQVDEIRTGQAHIHTNVSKAPNHMEGYQPNLHKHGMEEPVVDFTTVEVSRVVGTPNALGHTAGQVTQSGGGLRGKNGDTESDLYNLVDVTTKDIKDAELSEVQKEKSMLSGALSSMGSSIYSAVARLWGGAGDDVDQNQVNEIAEEIKEKVEEEMLKELETEAEDIEEEVVAEIEVNVENEEENDTDIKKIENDVLDHEKQALSNVRDRIGVKAKEIQSNLPSRTAVIEKEMIEKKLSKQLGYEVKLVVVGDQVQAERTSQMVEAPPPQQQQDGYYPPPPQQQQAGYYLPPQQQQQQQYYAPPPNQQQQQIPPPQYSNNNAYRPPQTTASNNAYRPPASNNAYRPPQTAGSNNAYRPPANNNAYRPPQTAGSNNAYRPPANNNAYRPPQSNPGLGSGRN